MTLQHKKLARIGDEYSCAFCGKMWSIDDQDPPSCSAIVAIVGKGVRTMRSGPNPEMQNLPREGVKSLEEYARVSDGNHLNPDEMRAAFHADYAELEEKVMAGIAEGRMCASSPIFGHPYGLVGCDESAMYIIGYETPDGWKGAAIYARSGDAAMRYFQGAFGHQLNPKVKEALVLDKAIGAFFKGSLAIPHAELRTFVLRHKSKYDTATGIKYELLSPIKFIEAVSK